jgi:Helix-turn-helix domain
VSNQKPSCGQATNGQYADVAEFKAACERAIVEFVQRTKEERLAHGMPPHERGKLDSTGRILVINQGLLDAMASLLRRRPMMDCAPAVYTLLMLYSDNENGCATLGIGRIARLFSRSDDSIRNALDVLEACGLIASEAPLGKPKRYWPVFDPLLATRIGHITWFADALAPVEPPGRPRKADVGNATGNVVEFPAPNNPP